MKDELQFALNKFEKAVLKLKEGTEQAKDELEKDGVIQRFEFTFELLWKSLKIFLNSEGITARTPKESLKESFKIGWIDKEGLFLDMLEDRNKTSHIYDKTTSEEIFNRIKSNYVKLIEEVLIKLKKA